MMIARRELLLGTAAGLAMQYLITPKARGETPRLRHDVQGLSSSDPFFSKYADAVQKMHQLPASDSRNWRNQALIHLNHCPHGAQDFLHWHRHYILNYELICGQLIGDPNFSLCYWNWSANRGIIPDPFFDLDLLNVQYWNDPSNAQSDNWSPFPVTTNGSRGLAKGQGLQDDPRFGSAFSAAAIDRILRLSNFDLFTGRLEGSPHNNGHVVSGGINGHMADGMSPLDPIFWLHHCNVDRLWAQWQTAGNSAPALDRNYDGQFVNGDGQSVNASSESALDFASLGYTYDVISSPFVAETSRRLALQPFERQTVLRPQSVAAQPQVIGANQTAVTVQTGMTAKLPVSARDLLPSLFGSRTFWAPDFLGVRRLAAEPSRILGRITGVVPPENRAAIVVNVFVNCPYLSPETPSNDPHYAGTFSFFGMHAGLQHAVLIDLTESLRSLAGEGQIASNEVEVQLMAVPTEPNAPVSATFSVRGIELLRV